MMGTNLLCRRQKDEKEKRRPGLRRSTRREEREKGNMRSSPTTRTRRSSTTGASVAVNRSAMFTNSVLELLINNETKDGSL